MLHFPHSSWSIVLHYLKVHWVRAKSYGPCFSSQFIPLRQINRNIIIQGNITRTESVRQSTFIAKTVSQIRKEDTSISRQELCPLSGHIRPYTLGVSTSRLVCRSTEEVRILSSRRRQSACHKSLTTVAVLSVHLCGISIFVITTQLTSATCGTWQRWRGRIWKNSVVITLVNKI